MRQSLFLTVFLLACLFTWGSAAATSSDPTSVPEHHITAKTPKERLRIWRSFVVNHRHLSCQELSPNNLETVCGGQAQLSLQDLLEADNARLTRLGRVDEINDNPSYTS